MSLRKQVLQEVDDLLGDRLQDVAGALERSIVRKQAEPARWAAFHSGMYRRLPRWARIRRAWHLMRNRRFTALSEAFPKALPVTASLRRAFPAV